MNNFYKLLITIFSFVVAILSVTSYAANISPEQIKQFQSMPKAQQQALAKSMGLDLNALEGQLSSSVKPVSQSMNTPTYPRGTKFDDGGAASSSEPEIAEPESDELKPFGYEVFANEPFTFAPVSDIAIAQGYILGPGDVVSIQFFGKENADYQLAVSREGQIVIPKLGPFKVAGLSFEEMKRFLAKRIEERIIGVDVIVSIAEMRSMRVFVLGDAYKPGPYTLSSLSSISHALFAAGGISDIGSLRNIQLKRSGKLVSTLDLYDLLIKGDSSSDALLQSGDVIFIEPVGQRVFIEGEVRRPAIYELKSGERFKDVLTMAGGTLPSAFPKSTRVERYSANYYRNVIDIDLTKESDLQRTVAAGDHIYVKKSTEMFEKSVTLIGAITRPGKYQWQPGKKIADLFPQISSYLLPHADLNYSLIIREIDEARNIEVHQFNLSKAIAEQNSLDNFELKANDKVVVFSLATKLSEEKVTLDSLAYTQEELFKVEKNLAKKKYQSQLFWQKYGKGSSKYKEADDVAETEQLINASMTQMAGGEIEQDVDIRELALFSRQRLLIPIIKQLRQQGAAGEPIRLIEIDGEVKFPGIYPLANNARVSDLVSAAGGVKESAFLARAEITRNRIEGIEARKVSKNIKLASALSGVENENVLLKSKDRLNVHKIPSWSENHVVELRGEFVFPGKYTIRRGDTLADLIAKAGGLTGYAHVEGSVFSRAKLKLLEQNNLIKLASDLRLEIATKSLTESRLTTSYAEAQRLLSDLTKLEPLGRLVIDLPELIKNKDYDVLLENGDILYVPVKSNSINVIGQVQVTSSHMFDKKMDAEDYISQSGGMKKRADAERIYIISANGSIKVLGDDNWFSNSAANSLQVGDTVVVPLDAEYMNNLTLWSTATQIMYNTAVAFAAINGI